MRFDDRIATVLAQPAVRADERAARWRQLVDLLAQRGSGASGEAARAYEFLRAHRGAIAIEERRRIAGTLVGLPVDPELILFFADDHPAVAAPLIAGAQLKARDWVELLPRLGPTARALLRHRSDLDPEVRQALAAFGPSDLILEQEPRGAAEPSENAAEPGSGETQIRDLVARIEAFRREREAQPPKPAPQRTEPIDGFRWETGPEGLIFWVDGEPRSALVGQSIAAIAERGQHGVDGQAAGAFEKRAPFRDARFSVAGTGPAAGDWRISGVPYFDPQRGSFLGYRGTARRPRLDEVAQAPPPGTGLFGTEFPADSLRQLIHELRTPLNAISGFAQMIEGQYMGPAGDEYRARAAQIMDQAARLLSAVDDLDTAARIESRRIAFEQARTDAVGLICRLHDSYERVAHQRGSHLAIRIETGLPAARVEQGATERMVARMLAATIGLARHGETIAASVHMDELRAQPMLCLAIDRPQAIAGLSEGDLLDPGYSPDGDWPGAPALGLGFALRLVRNLAEAVGGGLEIGETRLCLYLPPFEPASGGQSEEGTG